MDPFSEGAILAVLLYRHVHGCRHVRVCARMVRQALLKSSSFLHIRNPTNTAQGVDVSAMLPDFHLFLLRSAALYTGEGHHRAPQRNKPLLVSPEQYCLALRPSQRERKGASDHRRCIYFIS